MRKAWLGMICERTNQINAANAAPCWAEDEGSQARPPAQRVLAGGFVLRFCVCQEQADRVSW